jgi:hypothetical protein
VPGIAEFGVYLLTTTLFCLTAGWLVVLWGVSQDGKNLHRKDAKDAKKDKSKGENAGFRLQITVGYLLAVFGLLALPAALNYAVNGATITWILPDLTTCFLGFLNLLQMAANAIGGMALIGVTALYAIFQTGK